MKRARIDRQQTLRPNGAKASPAPPRCECIRAARNVRHHNRVRVCQQHRFAARPRQPVSIGAEDVDRAARAQSICDEVSPADGHQGSVRHLVEHTQQRGMAIVGPDTRKLTTEIRGMLSRYRLGTRENPQALDRSGDGVEIARLVLKHAQTQGTQARELALRTPA